MILFGCCFLAGCRAGGDKGIGMQESNMNTEYGVSENGEKTSSEFLDRIQKNVSENVKINAECMYPEGFVAGKAIKVVQSGDTLWDCKESIVEKFTKGQPVMDVRDTNYGDFQSKSYTLTENTGIYIATANVLNYFSDQSAYVLNTIMDDTRFSDYNGNLYQQRTDLDFMSQDDAWNQVSSFLNEIGVEVSDDYTCYVMEYSTMEQEEDKIYQALQEQDMKPFEKKEQWTVEDDSYYFKTHLVWNGYPVIPYMSGEGIDEQNVSIVYDKTGITSLTVNGDYPMEMKNEIDIKSPEKVADLLSGVLKDIISEATYEIQKVVLCQAIIGVDHETGIAEIVPSWKCSVLVKSGEDDPGYIKNYYYDAETLKNIG